MHLTRRGRGALVVVGVAILLGVASGPRSLNAAAAPLLVAVGAGVVQVYRAGEPTVERTQSRRGFPGETRSIELSIDGTGVSVIEERLSAGLSGSTVFERTLPASVSYDVTLTERGVQQLGPPTVRTRDVLGLVEATYEPAVVTELVVYPEVYATDSMGAVVRRIGPESNDRTEFDRLREYVPGDSLRDVSWKASAKYDDLLVTEYTDPTAEETITIAAAGQPMVADEMATATATLFVGAIRAGLTVELLLPSGSLGAGYGETHRRHGLDMLARTEGGTLPDEVWERADVTVDAWPSGVQISIGGAEYALEELTISRDNPIVSEGVA